MVLNEAETKSVSVAKNRQTEKAISVEASGSGITKKAEDTGHT